MLLDITKIFNIRNDTEASTVLQKCGRILYLSADL